MIGILCNPKKVEEYVKCFHSILKSLNRENDIPVVVFTISGIDFTDKTVRGNLITGREIKQVKISIPSVTYNFSTHHKRSENKKLRSLVELEGFTVINETNRFEQWMVLKIIASSETAWEYVLPYNIYETDAKKIILHYGSDWLIIPDKSRNDLNIYLKRDGFSFKICCSGKAFRCSWFNVQNTLQFIMSGGKWIVFEVPELLTAGDTPIVARAYIQKGKDGLWYVIGVSEQSCDKCPDGYCSALHTAALELIDCISCFIPALGLCYIDFVFDKEGRPYFKSFGGWDSGFLQTEPSAGLIEKVCRNMLDFGEYIIKRQDGGSDYVG